jgi:23S rRNA U2552 (ribose-2'-O)-methylase RlmE/FtsJ
MNPNRSAIISTLKNFSLEFKDLLDRKSLFINIPAKERNKTFKINYTESHKIKQPNFNLNLYNIIVKYKTFIDNKTIQSKWNRLKLFTNLFELISYNNTIHNISSLIDYTPLSRAYFKFQEIIIEHDLVDNSRKSIRYAGLAEGPGGFVECFINHRRSCFQDTYDHIYCITLKSGTTGLNGSSRNATPEWNKIQKLLSERKRTKANVVLSYGKDGTGDLYNLENILHFRDKVLNDGGQVDIVSGDGGLDYSVNFNFQEQLSFHLIFCEVVSAFTVLKSGGCFVLKIFDINTSNTLQMLFLLSNYFEKMVITKPYTSRPANSEKYLVCKGFTGISQEYLNKLFQIIKAWDITKKNSKYVDNIFAMKVPPYFKKNIMNYCNYISKIQIENIIKTILCRNFNKQQIDSLLRSQITHTIYWAIKYKQPINFKSPFFKAFKG